MPDGPSRNDQERPDGSLAKSMREAQPFIDAIWQFIAAVGVMTWVGHWADGRFGTSPWLMVAGALLGFLAGSWAFAKVVLRMGQKRPPADRKE